MKAILEFDLGDSSDLLAHRRAVNSTNAYLALYEIEKRIRYHYKYGNSDTLQIEQISENFYSILSDYDINFNDME